MIINIDNLIKRTTKPHVFDEKIARKREARRKEKLKSSFFPAFQPHGNMLCIHKILHHATPEKLIN